MVYDLGIIKRQRYVPTSNTFGVGGTIVNAGGYVNHIFTASGAFIASYIISTTGTIVTPSTFAIDYLVVAGGGGGGAAAGGGGGAGGFLTTSGYTVSTGTAYTVTVGAGGAGSTSQNSIGSAGNNSVFSTITAIGGGGGQSNQNATVTTGGSGGGSAGTGAGSTTPGNGTAGQGNNGGTRTVAGSAYGSGGGGGAGGVGGAGSGTTGGAGGTGTQSSITGTPVYYAGGGGGSTYAGFAAWGVGGLGGGGTATGTTGGSGTTNTGGGGGGGGQSDASPGAGGNGGSGIVVLKVPNLYTASFSTGVSVVTSSTAVSGYNIYSVTSGTGTLSFTSVSTSYTGVITTIPIEVLMVGGGAGGGGGLSTNARGGGGGAGALLYQTTNIAAGVSNTITVGAGGAGGATGLNGTNGGNTVAFTKTLLGGGGGGAWTSSGVPTAGGSGGGAGTPATLGGTSTQFATYGYGVGFAGGASNGSYTNNSASSGGGGGGSGGAGTAGVAGVAGRGGTGTNAYSAFLQTAGMGVLVTGTFYIAGGGGGGGGTAAGVGGIGGGGNGAFTTDVPSDATIFTGSGGGGGGGSGGGNSTGGAGASGVVIVRYPSGITNDLLYNAADPYFSNNALLLSNPTAAPTALSVDYLLVGGGGGGGYQNGGGGGGAGGLLTGTTSTILTKTSYAIAVGGGGAGSTANASAGVTGGATVFSNITVLGGGGGGSGDSTATVGATGGSGGGGASATSVAGAGGAGTAGQGNAGGAGWTDASNRVGGGGGGAFSRGSTGTVTSSGAGGTGTFTTLISTTTAIALGIGQYVTATNAVYFAGGGSGAGYLAIPAGAAGLGGGGAGVVSGAAGSGLPNTGGGGGGTSSGGTTGRGGSGIVLLRVPNTYAAYFSAGITASLTTATITGYNVYSVTSGTGTVLFDTTSSNTILVDYLVVGGGGGGGAGNANNSSAGGGAGGLLTSLNYSVAQNSTFVVTVGGGGLTASTGTSSSIVGLGLSVSALGGGAGASSPSSGQSAIGGNGASGGGSAGWNFNGTIAGGLGTAGQGTAGGGYTGSGAQFGSGGGGGAWSAGGQGSGIAIAGGLGGTGTFTTLISTTTAIALNIGHYITATNAVYFAGGGGGAANNSVSYAGGWGGGGTGNQSLAGTPGKAYTGGGGSGGGVGGTTNPGGSGVVIFRTLQTVSATTIGKPLVATDGSYVNYIFTSSGSIQFASTPIVLASTNTSFVDSSFNLLTITPTGTPTQGSFTPFGNNWSVYLNGSSYLQTPAYTATFSGSFTFECWAYITAYGTTSAFFTIGSEASGRYYFALTGSGGQPWSNIYGGANLTWGTSTSVPLNKWTHIAWVCNDGTSLYCIVNGVSLGFQTISGTIGNTGGVTIGASPAGSYLWTGYLSNVRLTNGTALYSTSTSFTPPALPLNVASGTRLLTCASNRFLDKSGISTVTTATYTVTGTPTVSRFSPFAQGYAYNSIIQGGSAYFNGTTDYLSIPNSTAFNFGTGDFTVEFWLYCVTAWTSMGIAGIAGQKASDTTNGWQIYRNNTTNTDRMNIRITLGVDYPATSGPSTGVWEHWAVVRSSGTLTWYRNGVAAGSYTGVTANISDTTGTFRIGQTQTWSQYLGQAYLSNLRIVNGTAVYTTAFTPPAAPVPAINATTSTSLLLNFTNAAVYDASMQNDVITASTAGLSTTVTKFNSRSMKFNGTSDYLSIPVNTSFGFGLGDFTVEYWFYQTSTVTTEYEIWESTTTSAFAIYKVTTSGALSWRAVGGTDQTILTHANVPINTWTHIAVCRASGTTKAFVNGVQTNSVADTTNYVVPTVVYTIGGRNGGSNYFPGYIDDFRVTKGVARYTANFIPPTAVPKLK